MKKEAALKRILILLIILFVSIFWVYYSGFVDIKSKSENISQTESQLSNSIQQSQYMSLISHDVSLADSSIKQINDLIIDRENDVVFIEKFESIAKKNGLDIKINSLAVETLTTQNDNKMSDNLTTLKIKATTNGSWQKTYIFLTQLESLPFVIRIDKFALINSSDTALDQPKKGIQNWQAIIEMRVLKYK